MKMSDNSQQTDFFGTELDQTLLPEDFHAKTSASQGEKPELKASDQDYGQKSPVLLASYNPDTQSWKTSQTSLVATGDDGLDEFLETWPRSGMTRNGTAYQLVTLVPHTEGTEFGLLLTPSAQGWKAWTFRNPYALIRKNHADGNLQEQLMRRYRRMITPEFEEQLMGFPKSWTDLNA